MAELSGKFKDLLEKANLAVEPGIVLMATSVIDATLRNALFLRMPNITLPLAQKLFTGYGPLASLNAKIDIAHALGIINKHVWADLHEMRRIRNLFAHPERRMSFEDAEIRKLVAPQRL